MKLIIDSRMRKQEKECLSKFGELIEIPYQNTVYEEISSHPDIFFCKIDNKLFRAPNLNINIGTPGNSTISIKYPNDVKYNICQIGKNIVHNFQYTDPKILEYIENQKLNNIHVNQGYSKCSICPTSSNSCITSDEGIYETLKSKNIDTLLIKDETINLLDKNGIKTKMNGFIGGATAIINNNFILFGDIEKMKNKDKILDHIKKYDLELIDFKNLEINDYGSVITI